MVLLWAVCSFRLSKTKFGRKDERHNAVLELTEKSTKLKIFYLFSQSRPQSEFVALPLLWDTRGRSAI